MKTPKAEPRTDTVTDVKPGDYVMHAGRRTRVVAIERRCGGLAQLDVPVKEFHDQSPIQVYSMKTGDFKYNHEMQLPISANYWPNWWPISTLHSLACQCFPAR